MRDHEPRLGLDGGPDGLRFYGEIIPLLPGVTAPAGVVGFEIGDAQGRAVSAAMESAGFADVTVHKDYGNSDRVVTARKP